MSGSEDGDDSAIPFKQLVTQLEKEPTIFKPKIKKIMK